MKYLELVIFNIIILSLFSQSVFAIPAFARKYNMSCRTCHSPAPSLKPYGDEFAGNGFKLADQDAPRYFVPTGDDELSLIRDFPLAIRMDGFVTYNNSKNEATDFASPYVLKILSGGALSDNVAYYFYFFFSERGEVAGIEDAFIMFNNVFGSELDVYLGQFQISDPLFKGELRLTYENYQIYRTSPGASEIDLTYDRGLMLTYGFETGTDLSFEILNGSGIGAANNLRTFDNDKYKNFLGRISQDVGENFRIGGFGFFGKEALANFANEVWMAGADASINIDPLEINLQFIERNDDNPNFVFNPSEDLKTRGAFAELIFRPNGDDSRIYSAGLFNWVESDDASQNYKAATFHLGYLLRRNIRLVSEFTYDIKREFGRIGLGFVSAF